MDPFVRVILDEGSDGNVVNVTWSLEWSSDTSVHYYRTLASTVSRTTSRDDVKRFY